MNIYLVRHAEKDTSAKNTTEEHYNRGLTGVGLSQAERLANQLVRYSINKIFSSDMPRAVQTAEIVASKTGISKIHKSKNLREADPCIIPNHPDRDKIKILCWQKWGFKPEHGESYNEGKQRFSDYFWREIVEKCNDKDNIIVISHGRVLRLFLSEFLKGGKEAIRKPYSYVAITHLVVNKRGKKLKVLNYNDNSFLPQDLRT